MGAFELETGPLDEESKALAAKELRETPENVKNGIEKLRQLLEGWPYFFLFIFFFSLGWWIGWTYAVW